MNRIFFMIFAGFALILSTSRCYNDNETDLYPFVPCDSTQVTYNKTITSLMATNCNRCHAASIANGSIITDNYESVKTLAVSGILWNVVNQNPGAKPMPQDGPKLSSCDLAKIKHWINSGAPSD